MVERRNFQRIPFATEVKVVCSGETYTGELLDISLQGALIDTSGNIPLKKGDTGELQINLSGSEVTLKFDVDLIHKDNERFGFRFIGEDTETMTHLRRLLELNVGSSEVIDKEISFWLKDLSNT